MLKLYRCKNGHILKALIKKEISFFKANHIPANGVKTNRKKQGKPRRQNVRNLPPHLAIHPRGYNSASVDCQVSFLWLRQH